MPSQQQEDTEAILYDDNSDEEIHEHEEQKVTVHSCHPDSKCHKLFGLVLMCTLGFGSYFCYDNPGALQDQIKNTMGVSTYQFENLYAFYSWPNVILPIIGGYLLDNVFGIRLGAVIFAAFICLGQVITSLGAFFKSFVLMEISRFIFGIGGESLAVAQNTYASVWFRGNILNMVFGLQLSIARVGSTANFQVVGPLFEALNKTMENHAALGWTLMIAGVTTIFSLIGKLY